MRRKHIRNNIKSDEKIVVGEIMGGLGNQLFIIFTTIAYGFENDCDYFVKNVESKRRTYFDTPLYKNIKQYNKSLNGFQHYREKSHNYDPIPKKEKIVLKGYYQSYKYFHKYRDIIIEKLDIFKIREELKNIDGYLHFRLGDYKYFDCHPICTIDYYIECLQDIEKKDLKKNKTFMYFYEKEDIQDVENKINTLREKFPNINFISVNTDLEDYKQMLSMTTLKYCIIPNSTFSWWGAYLNNRKDKVVYYPDPDKWFATKLSHLSAKDLILEEWKKDYNPRRNAYLLTVDKNSERAIFSTALLEKIGFDVIIFEALKDKYPMVSHRNSMHAIYEKILNEEKNNYCYIFEDDINTLIDIDLEYITNYERLNEDICYFGFCYNNGKFLRQENKINDKNLSKLQGGIRGIHSLCVSRKGVEILKNLYDNHKDELHMDVLLEEYTLKNPLYVIREDLISPCHPEHFGIFYQDRIKYKSQLDKCSKY